MKYTIKDLILITAIVALSVALMLALRDNYKLRKGIDASSIYLTNNMIMKLRMNNDQLLEEYLERERQLVEENHRLQKQINAQAQP